MKGGVVMSYWYDYYAWDWSYGFDFGPKHRTPTKFKKEQQQKVIKMNKKQPRVRKGCWI